MVGLRLPIIDVIGPEDVLDLMGDLILGSITDELVHSTVSADIALQCIDKLLTRPHWVGVRNQRLFPNKKLWHCYTTINSRGIRINSVCGNSFMSPGDIKGRIPELEMPFQGEGGN